VADGKGTRAWTQVQNIPMTPLADAPPRNLFFIRGCWYVIRQDFRFLLIFRLVFTTDIQMNRLTHIALPQIYSRPVTLTIPNKEKRIRKIL
jgi:hypothetical protein